MEEIQKDVILKINTFRTDLKRELTEVLGIDVSGWDTTDWYYETDKVIISWIGDYVKYNPVTEVAVHSFPGFKFALIRWKGDGEIDISKSTRLAKFVEETPLRVFL